MPIRDPYGYPDLADRAEQLSLVLPAPPAADDQILGSAPQWSLNALAINNEVANLPPSRLAMNVLD
jgi:hypothetical protein